MGIQWITSYAGHEPGPVNLRVIGDRALVIDTGLDEGRTSKFARRLLQEDAEFAATSAAEAALARRPELQPLLFSGGGAPLPELTVKFLMPKPVDVAVEVTPGYWAVPEADSVVELEVVDLAGHSPGQIGLRAGDVLFCGDALFPEGTWSKYGPAYFADIDRPRGALDTLDCLAVEVSVAIPGHGPAVSGDGAAWPTFNTLRDRVTLNRQGLQRLVDIVTEVIRGGDHGDSTDGLSLEQAIEGTCLRLGIAPMDIP